MRTRVVPYAPFGAKLDPLPSALETQIVTPLGELPTATVHYPRQGVNAVVLDGITELAVEYWNGTGWVEPPNSRFLSLKGSFDHLEDVPTRRYDFVGLPGWMLRQAKVWAPNGLPVDKDGKVQFNAANAGTIMATLVNNAKGRGWGSGIAVDFSSTVDSSGVAWSKVLTIAYELNLDLETVLSNLYQQGVCDYRFEGRTLRIFNPDTTIGRDLTVGADPVRLVVVDGQSSAPEDWTNEDLTTDALVLGDAGKSWTFNNGAVTPLGRLERVISQGGVTDPGTASLLADEELLRGSQTRISYTREFVVTPASAEWPFRDYLPGDWVMAQRGTGFEKLRTYSLSISIDDNGVRGHAVLGDRLEDLLTKLARRTRGITGGTSAGGSGAKPAPEGPDNRTPSAPTGLVAQVSVYLDDHGLPQGLVDLDWAHSGNATDGTAMTIDRYQVYSRINVVGELWKQLGSTQSTELPVSPLQVFKADGVTREQYEFRVRAIAQSNSAASAWSSPVAVTMVDDTTAPPVPEFLATNVTTWLRAATVRWSGKGKTGSTVVDMPRDFDHVNVWQGTSSTGPWMQVGKMYGAYELWQSGMLPVGQVWFSLTAVDRSGNESARSAVQSISAVANVDLSLITDKLDAAKILIANIGAESIKSGAILEDKLAANAVTQAKIANGAIALTKLDTLANDKIQKGIDDALIANGKAVTADGKAGTAQTAADAARKLVDAAIASGQNLVLNGSFETDDYWTTNSRQYSRTSATSARTGAKVMFLQAAGGTNQWPLSGFVPSAKGRTFYVEAWFKRINAWTAGRVGFVVQSTTTVGGTSTITTGLVNGSVASESVWTKITATYTIPDTVDAYRTRFAPWVEGGVNTVCDYEVDDFIAIDMTESKTALDAADKAQKKADDAFADAQTALESAGLAQGAANSKNSVYYTTTAPSGTGFKINDIWFRSPDNKVHVWDGSAWQARADTAIATAQSAAVAADGKAVIADKKGADAAIAATAAAAEASLAKIAAIPSDRDPAGANKWLFTRIDLPAVPASLAPPTLDYFASILPSTQAQIPDGVDLVKNVGTWYKGSLRTSIRVATAGNLTFTTSHDDGGSIYLDGVQVYTRTTYGTAISISFPVTVGWHILDLVWTEGSGNDGWYGFNAAMGTLVAELVAPSTAAGAMGAAIAAQTAATNAATAATNAGTAAAQGIGDALTAFNKAGTAQETADGKNTSITSLNTPGSTANKAGDVWWRRDANNILIGQWEGKGGTTWVQQTMGNAMFANIDAGKIVTGYLNGARIEAGTISADKVLIGAGTNVIPDIGFTSATMTALRTAASDGVMSVTTANDMRMITTGTGNFYFRPLGVDQSATQYQQWIPVEGGDKWLFKVTLQIPAGMTGDLRLTGRSKDGQTLTTAFSSIVPYTTFSANGVYEYHAEVPAGTYWMLPEIRLSGLVGTAYITGNTLTLRQKTSGKLIVDGSITAVEIKANTLTSASGVFGTIDANIINAGTLNAARMNAGDIRTLFLTAGKITAGDIVSNTLTSASGVFGTMDASVINAGTINAARLDAGDIRAKFIAAGKIVATEIAGGTITVASGIIGSLDIGKVTTGKMNAVFLEAGSITTELLQVSDLQNYAPNGRHIGGRGWGGSTGGPGTGWDTNVYPFGGERSSKLMEQPQGTSNMSLYTVTPTDAIPCKPGEVFRVTTEVRKSKSGAQPTVSRFAQQVYFYDAAGTTIGNNGCGDKLDSEFGNNVWTTIGGLTPKAPDGAVGFKPRLTVYHDASIVPNGQIVYTSDVKVLRANGATLIEPNSITTGQVNATDIAAGIGSFLTINVSQLNATSAGIGTAVIDKLYTDVVRSRKITTDMLIVTQGSNLIPDANLMDTDTNALKAPATGWTRQTAAEGYYLQYKTTATTAQSAYYNLMPVKDAGTGAADKSDWIAVMEGEKYLIRTHWYQYAEVTAANLYINYERGDGTTGGFTFPDTTGAGHKQNDWEWTVPAGVRWASPRIVFKGAASAIGTTLCNMYCDKTAIIKKQDASLIVDGGIVAKHITASEEMWTKTLGAHKINVGELDANNITSDTGFVGALKTGILTADSVNSTMVSASAITSKHTITGATIQTTATSNRGVKLTSTGLKAYSSSGVNTFALDAATGNVVATGTVQTSPSGSRVLIWDRLDGTAAADFYTDTTGQHGSIYTQTQPGNGGYVTNVMHYTGTPISTTNWTSRLTLFADETWAIGQRTGTAQVTGDANGQIYFRGKMLKNSSVVNETFVIGSTVQSGAAQGTYALTYAAPVSSGTRTVLATADAGSYVQCATQTATASGFSWIWSTNAINQSVSMRYLAVWTT